MNYTEQINAFWLAQEEHSLSTTDIALYFNLLKICNAAKWVNPFKRNTAKILSDLCISRPTLERSRNRLKQAGLIEFKSLNGSPNVTYVVADLTKNITAIVTACDKGIVTGHDAGRDTLNSSNTIRGKVVEFEIVNDFLTTTATFRHLGEKYKVPIPLKFKEFWDLKVDLGEFNNQTKEDLVKFFSYWLPKNLIIESDIKKQSEPKGYKRTAQPDYSNVSN